MENYSNQELEEIANMDAVKEMIAILDNVLDGEVYRVRTTEMDNTIDVNLKPVIPAGLENTIKPIVAKSKVFYAYALQVLIALLVQLNPQQTEEDEDYFFRMAIITNSLVTGCIFKNKNWIQSEVKFDKEYVKKEGKNMLNKYKREILGIREKMDAAYNFLAFSTMNMVRFNHHFPNDKINLITKSLISLSEEHRRRILREDDLHTFYSLFVTAARIVNDKLFYEKFLLKMKDEKNEYMCYSVLGTYDPHFEEEVINIRKECTPNSFLILDIIKEVISDLQNKKLFFLIPYKKQLASLMAIRKHIRLNPFQYHPAKNFYNCKALDFDKIQDKFKSLMQDVGSFIFEYTDNMYESVRSAKCRIKYQKSIKKEDEILVKAILDIANTSGGIDEKAKEIIRKKLFIKEFNINEESDIKEIINEDNELFEKLINEENFN